MNFPIVWESIEGHPSWSFNNEKIETNLFHLVRNAISTRRIPRRWIWWWFTIPFPKWRSASTRHDTQTQKKIGKEIGGGEGAIAATLMTLVADVPEKKKSSLSSCAGRSLRIKQKNEWRAFHCRFLSFLSKLYLMSGEFRD